MSLPGRDRAVRVSGFSSWSIAIREPIFYKGRLYQRTMVPTQPSTGFRFAAARRYRAASPEYFADMRNGFAPLMKTYLRAARIFFRGSPQSALRWNVSGMARQFIAGRNPDDVMKALRKRRRTDRFHRRLVRRSGRERTGRRMNTQRAV